MYQINRPTYLPPTGQDNCRSIKACCSIAIRVAVTRVWSSANRSGGIASNKAWADGEIVGTTHRWNASLGVWKRNGCRRWGTDFLLTHRGQLLVT